MQIGNDIEISSLGLIRGYIRKHIEDKEITIHKDWEETQIEDLRIGYDPKYNYYLNDNSISEELYLYLTEFIEDEYKKLNIIKTCKFPNNFDDKKALESVRELIIKKLEKE